MSKEKDIRLIADQVSNNEVDSDSEMIDFLCKYTKIQRELIEKIVKEERPKCLTNPTYEIDFEKYGLKNPNFK